MYKLASILTAALFSSMAFSADKDFIWSEFNQGSSKILYSVLESGSWSEAEVVVDDGKRNDSPSISTNADGSQLVVWNYSVEEDTVIAYRVRNSKDDSWSDVSLVNTGMNKNLTPTLTSGPNGGYWLFWVGNSDALTDEIYAASFDGQWSKVVNISAGDNGFDFDPIASINASGNVEVNWIHTDRNFFTSDKAKQLVNGQWQRIQLHTSVPTLPPTADNTEQALPSEYNEANAGYGSLNDYREETPVNGKKTIIQPTL